MIDSVEITVNGVAYSCKPTMGAMLRFKEETGKEINQMDGGFTDMCIYLWCCIKSAAARENKEFSLSVMEFADGVTPAEIQEWTALLRGKLRKEQEGFDEKDGKKKKKK